MVSPPAGFVCIHDVVQYTNIAKYNARESAVTLYDLNSPFDWLSAKYVQLYSSYKQPTIKNVLKTNKIAKKIYDTLKEQTYKTVLSRKYS